MLHSEALLKHEGRFPQIPAGRDVAGWKEVSIVENGEELVSLRDISPKIIVKPIYLEWGIQGATEQSLARVGVAERLMVVAQTLPNDVGLVIYDPYRAFETQKGLFDSFTEKLTREGNVFASEEELLAAVQVYVSTPSLNPDKPAPHLTGGAIDLGLIDLKSGHILDMGADFDHFGIESRTDFYENRSNYQDEIYRTNRRSLYWAMIKQGFTNYKDEYWHYDFGNQFWAIQTGEIARYGGMVKGVPLRQSLLELG